jgi:hypothetical protein
MFSINLSNIITWLLPTFLRGPGLQAWLKALVTPLQALHNMLSAYRTRKHYEMAITSQVIYLEKMLNDIYDPTNEAIYIDDIGKVDKVYLFNKIEGKQPPYIYNKSESGYVPTYLHNKTEITYIFNFVVMVPAAIYSDLLLNNSQGLASMKANINHYKLFGVTYTIQPY